MYIPVDVDLLQHPKLKKLARLLERDHYHTLGHLIGLWCWAMRYAEDGNISQYAADEIADGGGWPPTDAEKFCSALKTSGWLEDGKLHAWEQWAGKTLKALQKDAKRKQKERERERMSIGRPPDVRVPSTPDKEKDKEKEKEKENKRLWSSFDDRFWSSYPRKVAKRVALKRWVALKPTDDMVTQILSDISRRISSGEWDKTRIEYIPHPATYLNQHRWEDETIAKHDPNAFLKNPDGSWKEEGEI